MSSEKMDKAREEALINKVMVGEYNIRKVIKLFITQRLRYPSIKGRIGELEPNVYFGYTDHPLDMNGTAITVPFTIFNKNRGRSSTSLLWLDSVERVGNSFLFIGRGYNVFKVKDATSMNCHEYTINADTPYQPCLLQIDILQSGTYRLRLVRGERVPENQTPMLLHDIRDPETEVQLAEDTEAYDLTTTRIRLRIYKRKFRIEVFDADGRLITETGSQTKAEFSSPNDSFPLGFIADRASRRTYGFESFVMQPGEAVYGLGEHFTKVNKVGQALGLWNFEGMGNTSGRTYKNIPFFMSTQGYGVFINESRPITFWVGTRETVKNQFAVEGELIDYYFLYGPSFKSILNTYTNLTGKPHLPPLWTFGTWMSRISYFSAEQVEAVMNRLREMQFPCDVIHIDTGWFEKDWLCDWKFDSRRFPDPPAMFRQAHDKGFRISLWQIPYILDETGLYPEARQKGYLAENHGPFAFIGMFPAHVIDFSNPDAVAWYQNLVSPLLEIGVDALKTDFGEQTEPMMRFQKYDGRQMHNLFSLLYQKAAFEITQKIKGEENGVIWARSAYAGSQRYPVHWSGDNSSNFENMFSSLRGGLSLGLCGFTFWSQDTGGFVGAPSDELYIRWVQLSIFQSHLRFHGNPPQFREPWNFATETQEIVREYLNLRYQLIPYLYSESKVAASDGLPMLRHLVIEYQDDPTVHNIEDQFLCGRALLVAPILTRNPSRRVYLPEGLWYDFFTGKALSGPRWVTVTSDLDRIPVYVRGGTALPLGPVVQSTAQMTMNAFNWRIYPDENGRAVYDLSVPGVSTSLQALVKKDEVILEAWPGTGTVETYGQAHNLPVRKPDGG